MLLRGANDYMLDEMDRSLHDAFCIVKRVLESGEVVPGARAGWQWCCSAWACLPLLPASALHGSHPATVLQAGLLHTLPDPCLAPPLSSPAGGGAVEAALNVFLENFATTLGSREQLAIAEFADALLIIPKTLAVNAAKDATELVARLRAFHFTAQTKPDKALLARVRRSAAAAAAGLLFSWRMRLLLLSEFSAQ